MTDMDEARWTAFREASDVQADKFRRAIEKHLSADARALRVGRLVIELWDELAERPR